MSISERPRKKRTFGFWLGFIACAIAFEPLDRLFQYYLLAINAYFAVATVDAAAPSQIGRGNIQGYFLPNKEMTFSTYQADGITYESHRIKTNNLGWISHNDYRPRKSGEYRIGVVGDSFTASVTNSIPWTDVAQDLLNADKTFLASSGIKSFSIMNLGASGAGLPFMANPLAIVAKRLDVDMLLVNVITDALNREDAGIELDVEIPDARPEWDKVSGPAQPDYLLDGVGLNLYCTSGPPRLTNPECKTSPFWQVPPDVSFSPEKILQVKKAIARQRFLWSVLLTAKPIFYLDVFARAIASSSGGQEASAAPQAPDSVSQVVSQTSDHVSRAIRALEFMRRLGRDPIVIHSPVKADLDETADRTVFDTLVARLPKGFTITDMRSYLPIQGGRDVWTNWYLPVDGHWNDTGARVYGAATARFIRDHIRKERNIPRSDPEVICLSLYERFVKLMKAKVDLTPDAFAKGMRAIVQELPKLDDADRNTRSYADCGFASNAYLELAFQSNLSENGSDQDWDAALKLAGDPSPLLYRRYRERKSQGDRAGALADLSALIQFHPDATDLVLERGDIRLLAQDPAGALKDFKFVREKIGGASTQFRIMQAQFLLGDYADVVDTATAGLEQSPDNAAYYHLRASAEERLGRLENALVDYSAAINLSPNKTLFQLRANLLEALNRKDDAEVDRKKAAQLQ